MHDIGWCGKCECSKEANYLLPFEHSHFPHHLQIQPNQRTRVPFLCCLILANYDFRQPYSTKTTTRKNIRITNHNTSTVPLKSKIMSGTAHAPLMSSKTVSARGGAMVRTDRPAARARLHNTGLSFQNRGDTAAIHNQPTGCSVLNFVKKSKHFCFPDLRCKRAHGLLF